jgi:lysozyme
MLKGFESLRLTAYRDIRGILTIGYGHTGPEVVAGLVWTQEQATTALEEDVSWTAKTVQDLVTIPLIQCEFDALVSFTFNVGAAAFKGSTVLYLLNAGNIVGAEEQFGHWVYAGHMLSSGLVNRRKIETAMFMGVAA